MAYLDVLACFVCMILNYLNSWFKNISKKIVLAGQNIIYKLATCYYRLIELLIVALNFMFRLITPDYHIGWTSLKLHRVVTLRHLDHVVVLVRINFKLLHHSQV